MSFRRPNSADADLPPVWRSLARSLRIAYRAEPRLLVVSFVLVAGSWLPDAFGAMWLMRLIYAVRSLTLITPRASSRLKAWEHLRT